MRHKKSIAWTFNLAINTAAISAMRQFIATKPPSASIEKKTIALTFRFEEIIFKCQCFRWFPTCTPFSCDKQWCHLIIMKIIVFSTTFFIDLTCRTVNCYTRHGTYRQSGTSRTKRTQQMEKHVFTKNVYVAIWPSNTWRDICNSWPLYMTFNWDLHVKL